jgi:ATP-binding cassette subfamily E protein 1
MDQDVQNLSGGELQRVALTMCLGQPADIYLIDEPSAYLDSEQRIIASKVRGRVSVVVWEGKVTPWCGRA